ncbi:MAG: hypothetical protein ACLTYW_02615 [Collinsella sp.]
MMRACDQRLRLALNPLIPLRKKVPKYLAKIIDDEIVAGFRGTLHTSPSRSIST